MWTQLYVILFVILSTPNTYPPHCDFTWINCPFSAKTCGEKITAEHKDIAPFVSMRSASSVELSADTWGKIATCSPSLTLPMLPNTECFSHLLSTSYCISHSPEGYEQLFFTKLAVTRDLFDIQTSMVACWKNNELPNTCDLFEFW